MTEYGDYVRRLLAETRDEVTRADTKASIVLATAGIAVGVLLTGFATGDVSFRGERWYVGALAWISGPALLLGVALVGSAVFPRVGDAEREHARWFREIAQYGDDEKALAAAVETDRAEDGSGRDLHQVRILAQIVDRKYFLTQVGMGVLGVGLLTGVAAALLSSWS